MIKITAGQLVDREGVSIEQPITVTPHAIELQPSGYYAVLIRLDCEIGHNQVTSHVILSKEALEEALAPLLAESLKAQRLSVEFKGPH